MDAWALGNGRLYRELPSFYADVLAPIGIYANDDGEALLNCFAPEGTVEFSVADRRLVLSKAGAIALPLGQGFILTPLGAEVLGLLRTGADSNYLDALIEAFRATGVTVDRAT